LINNTKVRNQFNTIIACVAFSDLLWNIFTLIIAIINQIYYVGIVVNIPPAYVAAKVLWTFSIVFSGASTLWMSTIPIFLYFKLLYGKKYTNTNKFWIILNTINWTTAVLAALFTVILVSYDTTKYYTVVSWMIPLTASFIISVIFYIILIYKVKQVEKQDLNITLTVSSISSALLIRACIYQFGFMISWISGFILWIIFYSIKQCDNFPYEILILVDVLWQLQGLFNSIIFALTTKHFKDSWRYILLAPILIIPQSFMLIYNTIKIRTEHIIDEDKEELIINST